MNESKITFLYSAHDIRAAKRFTPNGVHSYPQIKSFNSAEHTIPHTLEGFQQKTQLLQDAAANNGCLLKGNLTRELKNESRKGSSNPNEETQNVIFDVDGIILPDTSIQLPLDATGVRTICGKIIDHLPSCFQNVSYVAHASSSMGMKGNKISFHLDFWLSKPIHPKALKDYLVHLNFALPIFARQLTLSASGNSLHFPLDRCLADNSRLIYIAHPTFEEGIEDPIPNVEDRIFGVTKDKFEVELPEDELESINAAKNSRAIKKKVDELRQQAGLPERKHKVSVVNTGEYNTAVVTNPDRLVMTRVEDRGDWVTYNVNGGDSAAYYVHKHDPAIVYNFKGEPNFMFEQAAPDAFQAHVQDFILDNEDKEAREDDPTMPIVFRDEASDAYYAGKLNTKTGYMQSVNKASRQALADYMWQHGGVMGENVETWNYEFRPYVDEGVNFKERFVNKYIPSPLMLKQTSMGPEYTPLTYDTAYQLEKYCPTIFQLIWHVCGSSQEEYTHFLNWLAAALQTRRKLGTAWIFHGVQGTGKGQLFEKIIVPLVGEGVDKSYPFAVKLRQDNLEDQFNQWEESALFAALDEFRLNDSSQAHKLLNKIKNMITDEENTVRGMRENLRRVKLYTNYVIFSNDKDMIYLPEDDRRFNVCPRQEIKLEKVWEDVHDALYVELPKELPRFARAMRDFEIDIKLARTTINNQAKRLARTAGKTSVDEFMDALRSGELEYFLPILDLGHAAPGADYTSGAKLLIQRAVLNYGNEGKDPEHRLTIDNIRTLYNCLIGRVDSTQKFAKLMARHGLETKKMRINGVVQRGVAVVWALHNNTIDEIQKAYDIYENINPDTKKVLAFPGTTA